MTKKNPPTRSTVELSEKKALAEKACVDFGIYGLLAEDNLNEIDGLISEGANAFKCFMGTELDTLVVGNYYLKKDDQNQNLKSNYIEKFELD